MDSAMTAGRGPYEWDNPHCPDCGAGIPWPSLSCTNPACPGRQPDKAGARYSRAELMGGLLFAYEQFVLMATVLPDKLDAEHCRRAANRLAPFVGMTPPPPPLPHAPERPDRVVVEYIVGVVLVLAAAVYAALYFKLV
jgi:hypothetical protein